MIITHRNVLLRSVDSVVAGIAIEHRKTTHPEVDVVDYEEKRKVKIYDLALNLSSISSSLVQFKHLRLTMAPAFFC